MLLPGFVPTVLYIKAGSTSAAVGDDVVFARLNEWMAGRPDAAGKILQVRFLPSTKPFRGHQRPQLTATNRLRSAIGCPNSGTHRLQTAIRPCRRRMGDIEPQVAGGKVLWHFTMSLDGSVAGPNHGMDWMAGVSSRDGLADEYATTTGAVLGGRDGSGIGHRRAVPPHRCGGARLARHLTGGRFRAKSPPRPHADR
ncbi:hypothetical protein ACH347_19485 [Saccharopolyspora sp. 5N102]|uniref:hypothetical protein n=1 Tax=Saccharopolyspora sp. 5N102 TaxID=3375155 RepID=UPI0037AC584E